MSSEQDRGSLYDTPGNLDLHEESKSVTNGSLSDQTQDTAPDPNNEVSPKQDRRSIYDTPGNYDLPDERQRVTQSNFSVGTHKMEKTTRNDSDNTNNIDRTSQSKREATSCLDFRKLYEVINNNSQEDQYWIFVMPGFSKDNMAVETKAVSYYYYDSVRASFHWLTGSDMASHMDIIGKAVVGYKILRDTKRSTSWNDNPDTDAFSGMNEFSKENDQEVFEFEEFSRMSQAGRLKNTQADETSEEYTCTQKEIDMDCEGIDQGLSKEYEGTQDEQRLNRELQLESRYVLDRFDSIKKKFNKAFEQSSMKDKITENKVTDDNQNEVTHNNRNEVIDDNQIEITADSQNEVKDDSPSKITGKARTDVTDNEENEGMPNVDKTEDRAQTDTDIIEMKFDKAFAQEIKYLFAELDFDLSMCRHKGSGHEDCQHQELRLARLRNLNKKLTEGDQNKKLTQAKGDLKRRKGPDDWCVSVLTHTVTSPVYKVRVLTADSSVEGNQTAGKKEEHPANNPQEYPKDINIEEYIRKYKHELYKGITVEEFLQQYPEDHLVDYFNDIPVQKYINEQDRRSSEDMKDYLARRSSEDTKIEEYSMQSDDIDYSSDIPVEKYIEDNRPRYDKDVTVEEYLKQYPLDYLVDYSSDISVEEYIDQYRKKYRSDITVEEYLKQYPIDHLVDYSLDIPVEKYIEDNKKRYEKEIKEEECSTATVIPVEQYIEEYLRKYPKDITVEEVGRTILKQYPAGYLVDDTSNIPVNIEEMKQNHHRDIPVEEYLRQYYINEQVSNTEDITEEDCCESQQEVVQEDVVDEHFTKDDVRLESHPDDHLIYELAQQQPKLADSEEIVTTSEGMEDQPLGPLILDYCEIAEETDQNLEPDYEAGTEPDSEAGRESMKSVDEDIISEMIVRNEEATADQSSMFDKEDVDDNEEVYGNLWMILPAGMTVQQSAVSLLYKDGHAFNIGMAGELTTAENGERKNNSISDIISDNRVDLSDERSREKESRVNAAANGNSTRIELKAVSVLYQIIEEFFQLRSEDAEIDRETEHSSEDVFREQREYGNSIEEKSGNTFEVAEKEINNEIGLTSEATDSNDNDEEVDTYNRAIGIQEDATTNIAEDVIEISDGAAYVTEAEQTDINLQTVDDGPNAKDKVNSEGNLKEMNEDQAEMQDETSHVVEAVIELNNAINNEREFTGEEQEHGVDHDTSEEHNQDINGNWKESYETDMAQSIDKHEETEFYSSQFLIEEKRTFSIQTLPPAKPLLSGMALKQGLYRSKENLQKMHSSGSSEKLSASNLEGLQCKYAKSIKIPDSLRTTVASGMKEETFEHLEKALQDTSNKGKGKEIFNTFQLPPLNFPLAEKANGSSAL